MKSTVAKKPKPGLARVGEGAEYLSVSRAYLYKLIERQEVPVRRIGSAIRIPWEWLERQATLTEEDQRL